MSVLRLLANTFALVGATLLVMPGCAGRANKHLWGDPSLAAHYKKVATDLEYPDLHCDTPLETINAITPWSVGEQTNPEYWDVTLAEAIQLAMANTRVLRDLGGQVIQSPGCGTRQLWPANSHWRAKMRSMSAANTVGLT